MIKICYIITDLGSGGAQKQLYELVKGINKEGFEPTVISLSQGDSWYEAISKLNVKVIELRRQKSKEFARLFRLTKLLFAIRPDVVHTYLFDANCYGRMAAILARVPIIIAAERNLPEIGKTKNWFKLSIDKFLAMFSTRIICNSRKSSEYLITKYGYDAEKVMTVYNGIDTSNIIKKTRLNSRGKPDQIVIGTVGRLCPQKNHRLFLDMAKIVLENVANGKITFDIVGEGTLMADLKRHTHVLGIADKVSFFGESRDVPNRLRNMDIFVLPSNYEGMSNSLMEAMAAGLPVIATAVGGNRELINHGVNGYLCPANDAKALAKRVLELIHDDKKAKKMGESGRITILSEFHVEKMTQETENIYLSLSRERTFGRNSFPLLCQQIFKRLSRCA